MDQYHDINFCFSMFLSYIYNSLCVSLDFLRIKPVGVLVACNSVLNIFGTPTIVCGPTLAPHLKWSRTATAA